MSANLETIKGTRRRWKTLDDLRRYGALVFAQLDAGTIEPDQARVMFYGLTVMQKLIVDGALEERIAKLETLASEKAARR